MPKMWYNICYKGDVMDKQEIRRMFENGVKMGAKRMAIICDTFEWEDYPVYDCFPDYEWNVSRAERRENMLLLMETYDLTADIDEQMARYRNFK